MPSQGKERGKKTGMDQALTLCSAPYRLYHFKSSQNLRVSSVLLGIRASPRVNGTILLRHHRRWLCWNEFQDGDMGQVHL